MDTDDLERRQALLDAWVETRRRIARLEAEAFSLMAERVGLRDAEVRGNTLHRDAIHRSMIAEYSAAGRIAQGTVDRTFADAYFLEHHYPTARAAFRRGAITGAHGSRIPRR
jgi:hypothetical protein